MIARLQSIGWYSYFKPQRSISKPPALPNGAAGFGGIIKRAAA
jgi:hypothetical protein